MGYFNYHAKAKRLIESGHFINKNIFGTESSLWGISITTQKCVN